MDCNGRRHVTVPYDTVFIAQRNRRNLTQRYIGAGTGLNRNICKTLIL